MLIHEATFLEKGTIPNTKPNRNQHSYLEEVLEMVASSDVEELILGHFSSRYTHTEILEKVRQGCQKYNLKIPVHCVLPGQKRQYQLTLK